MYVKIKSALFFGILATFPVQIHATSLPTFRLVLRFRLFDHSFLAKESKKMHRFFTIQGISIRLFPGCENMWWKHSVFLPAEGKQNATFSPDFIQSGKSLLEIPCTG